MHRKSNSMAAELQKEMIPPAPPPPENGEKQKVAPAEATLELIKAPGSQGSIEQYPMTEALQSALDAGMLRNPAARLFLQTLSQLRETDLKDAREEREMAQAEVNTLREKYHAEHASRLVLEERLRGALRIRRFQNAFITFGGIFFGCGLSATNFIFLIIGLAMLLIGWLFQDNSRKEQQ